jgi:integrase
MALVELFNRAPPPVPSMPGAANLNISPLWQQQPTLLGDAPGAGLLLGGSRGQSTPQALPAPRVLLQQAEAAALIAAAHGMPRFVCAAALLGVSAAELIALRGSDVDAGGAVLRVPGAWARMVPLPPWLATALATVVADDRPLLHDAVGNALGEDDLQAWIAFASIDAGLPLGASLSIDVLNDTCIDWLVGQGLRFSELPARVGRVDPSRVAAFAGQAAGPRLGGEAVEAMMPALRLPPPD